MSYQVGGAPMESGGTCYNRKAPSTRAPRSRHMDLRSLLDTENSFCLQNLAAGCCNTYWANTWGGRPSLGYTQIYQGDCRSDACDAGNAYSGYYHYRYWFCAPPGTTNITFEIWGGGGSGAKACCCQQGNPGGAGAYAIKTLCACYNHVTGLPFEGGTFGGMCWELYVATSTDDSDNCMGRVGCKSYVTGCGLSNFCADGGMPGKTCCYAFWCGRKCDDGEGNYGPKGAQETNCLNEYRPCYPMACSGMYTFHPCESAYTCDCACYYGADWGVPGKLGWFRSDCCENNCFTKLGVPAPGGLNGGWRCTNYEVQQNWGNACNNDQSMCVYGIHPGHCLRGQLPGRGTISATACAGGGCNGTFGSSGLIRVHYF